MTAPAADPKATIDGLINTMIGALAQERSQKLTADAQAAEEARQQRRSQIEQYFGDLWPVFEPYAAPAEIVRDRQYWTQFDVEPLALAPFMFRPYIEHGTLYAKYHTLDRQIDNYTRPGEIDKLLILLRGAFEDAREAEASRKAREAERDRQAEENHCRQDQLGAEYAAAYRAYVAERARVRKHNADLIAAWNKAHARPYQIKQIAYPVGADEDNAGEAVVNVATYPGGEWTDKEGYYLFVEYGGTATRRRYSRLLWEEAPITVTPGPGTSSAYQRQRYLGEFMIYARPAEEEITQTAADLLAAMLPNPSAPPRPDELWSMTAGKIEQEIAAELGQAADDDQIGY